MAGVFFWHNSYKIKSQRVNSVFSTFEYRNGHYLEMGNWNVLVFGKKNYEIQNWAVYDNCSICICGTFSYKGKFYDSALKILCTDVKNYKLDLNAFWGSFLILIYTDNQFYVIRDGAGLTRLYNYKNIVFSTSYMGLIKSLGQNLNFNRDAAVELLTTGLISGNQTLVKEITSINIDQKISNFIFFESQVRQEPIPNTREESVEQQLILIENYFKNLEQDWHSYYPNGIFDIGMTGGMDSRLLAAIILKQTNKVVCHTHWRTRQNQDTDFKYAHIFCDATGVDIHTQKVLSPQEMTGMQLEDNFKKCYSFSDGEIRPGCYWDEAYCTSHYRSALCRPPFLRLMGFGGEQYRNQERLSLVREKSLKSWIKWDLMYQYAVHIFTSPKAQDDICDSIALNIKSKCGFDYMDLAAYKKYVQVFQSPSYRSLQSFLENKLGFCINPFLDVNLSSAALLAIPFLGKSLKFQLDLINKINPKISAIPNSYGFNFTKGEPCLLRFSAILWQVVPSYIKYPLYTRKNKYYDSNSVFVLMDKHRFINDIITAVRQLSLPIDVNKLCRVRSRGRLVLNLGYFLLRNRDIIKI